MQPSPQYKSDMYTPRKDLLQRVWQLPGLELNETEGLHLFVSLLICLFVCLFVCLYACLFVCLFVGWPRRPWYWCPRFVVPKISGKFLTRATVHLPWVHDKRTEKTIPAEKAEAETAAPTNEHTTAQTKQNKTKQSNKIVCLSLVGVSYLFMRKLSPACSSTTQNQPTTKLTREANILLSILHATRDGNSNDNAKSTDSKRTIHVLRSLCKPCSHASQRDSSVFNWLEWF